MIKLAFYVIGDPAWKLFLFVGFYKSSIG